MKKYIPIIGFLLVLLIFILLKCSFFDDVLDKTDSTPPATADCTYNGDCIEKYGPGWKCVDGKCQRGTTSTKQKKEAIATSIYVDDDATAYIAGYYYDFDSSGTSYDETGYSIACYWVLTPTWIGDEEKFHLDQVRYDIEPSVTYEMYDSYAVDIAGNSNNDNIYIVENLEFYDTVADEWKDHPAYWRFNKGDHADNERFEFLVDDEVSSIFVDDNSIVYQAGKSDNGACYWANSAKTNIDPPSSYVNTCASICTIDISASTVVYIACNSDVEAHLCSIILPPLTITFSSLSPSLYSDVTDLFVPTTGSSTGIYVAGCYYTIPDGSIACYWINGVRIDIFPGTFYDSVCTAIQVRDNTVHITGTYRKNINTIPFYYIGNVGSGTCFDLYTSSDAETTSIYVTAGDVYITGNYYDGTTYLPCVWINGKKYDLTVED